MVRPIVGVLAVALVDAATHATVMGASSASTLRASNAVSLDEFFAALSDEEFRARGVALRAALAAVDHSELIDVS